MTIVRSIRKFILIALSALLGMLIISNGAQAIDITYTNEYSILSYYESNASFYTPDMTATVDLTGINGSGNYLTCTVCSVSEDETITIADADGNQIGSSTAEDKTFQVPGVQYGSAQINITVSNIDALQTMESIGSMNTSPINRVAIHVGDTYYNIFLIHGLASPGAFNVNMVDIDPLNAVEQDIYPSSGATPVSVLYSANDTLAANADSLGTLSSHNSQAYFELAPELKGFTTNDGHNDNYIYATAEYSNGELGCYQFPVVVEPVISQLRFGPSTSTASCSYEVGGENAGLGAQVQMASAANPGPLSIMGNTENQGGYLRVSYTNCLNSPSLTARNLNNIYGSLASIMGQTESGYPVTLINQTRIQELQNTISFFSNNPNVAVPLNSLTQMASLRLGDIPGQAQISAMAQEGDYPIVNSGPTYLTVTIPDTLIPINAIELLAGNLTYYNNSQMQSWNTGLNLLPSYAMQQGNVSGLTLTITSKSDPAITSSVQVRNNELVRFTGTELRFFSASWENNMLILNYSGGAGNIYNAGEYTFSVTGTSGNQPLSAQTNLTLSNERVFPSVTITSGGNAAASTLRLGPNHPTEQFGITLDSIPEDAIVIWRSSDPSLVSVNQNGLVTACKETETPVTVCAYANGVPAGNPISVTVSSMASRVTGLTPKKDTVRLTSGSSYQLLSNLQSVPETAPLPSMEPYNYEFTSSNPDFIIRNGMINTPYGENGTSTVDVTYSTGPNTAMTTSFEISAVNENVPATGITAETILNFGLNDTTPQNVNAQLAPAETTAQPLTVSYSSSNTAVAIVDSLGNVTPMGVGTATINTVYITQCPFGQFTASTAVSVVSEYTPPPVGPLTVDPSSLELVISPDEPTATATLTANIPEGATGPVEWSVASSRVATVRATSDSTATVTAVSAGRTTVTATCGELEATVSVRVTEETSPEPTGPLTVNQSSVNLTTRTGGINTATITASLPGGESETISWSSSAPTVASVASASNNTATITAVAPGEAVITASYGDMRATVDVTVNDNPIFCKEVSAYPKDKSCDYFTVLLEDLQTNPAMPNIDEQSISNVSIFTWSGPQQNDMNAKEAVRVPGTNNWTFEGFPVNDNAVHNYYYNADKIIINAYASTTTDSDGVMIGASEYTWMNGTSAGTSKVGYIAYCQDYGFVKPTLFDGAEAGTTGEGKHMEGLRVSSNVSGVEINASVHAANIGWMEAVGDGSYAGTMGENRQLEAIRLTLSGPQADKYYLVYSVHAANIGWMEPVSTLNGNQDSIYAGTLGESRQIEAFTVELRERP